MTATPQPAWHPPPGTWSEPPPSRWTAGRVVALVFGVLLLIPGLALLIGGGVLLWADTVSRTDDGYVMSDTEAFTSDGYALVSERIELSTGADWVPLSSALGTARVEVAPLDPADEVFIGIAPVADVSGYLGEVSRTVIDDLGFDNPLSNESLRSGGAPSGAPGEQDFWTTQSSGPGVQQLSWEPAEGDWVFVIMNTDGSAGVAVDGRIGATVPALGGLAWGLLITGLLLTAVGVLLIVLALRRRPGRSFGPPAGAMAAGPMPPGPMGAGPMPAGPPPAWRPPTAADRPGGPDAVPDSRSSPGEEPPR
jgi:hypothetical protein